MKIKKEVLVFILVGICVLVFGVIYTWERNQTEVVVSKGGQDSTQQASNPDLSTETAKSQNIAAKDTSTDTQASTSEAIPALSENAIMVEEQTAEKTIKAYIMGAVAKPGVYELAEGSRITDLLEMAGGADLEADLDRINLAAYVKDTQQIKIPKIGEVLTQAEAPAQAEETGKAVQATETENDAKSNGSKSVDGRININTANHSQLMELPGIGEAIANNIIQYREKNKFKKIEDIKNVDRIGQKTFDALKDLISVE